MFVLLGIAYSAQLVVWEPLVGSPPNAMAASNLNLTFSDWLWYGFTNNDYFVAVDDWDSLYYFKPKLHPNLNRPLKILK